jgi:hypothetical protein
VGGDEAGQPGTDDDHVRGEGGLAHRVSCWG